MANYLTSTTGQDRRRALGTIGTVPELACDACGAKYFSSRNITCPACGRGVLALKTGHKNILPLKQS